MEYIDFINKLADKSDEIIAKYYRKDFSIDEKSDRTPVTIADREVEQELRNMINQQYPEHGIIGEEFGSENTDAEYVWILDPIDGTVSFTVGRPLFCNLIALTKNNKPILGLINQPIVKDRFIGGKNTDAKLNQGIIKTRNCKKLSNAIIATTGPNYFSEDELLTFNKIESYTKRVVYGGDSYNYALLAAGNLDIVMESGLSIYDYAALIPVIEAAGGVVTDWSGNDIKLQNGKKIQILVSANKELHNETIMKLNNS